VRLDQLGNVLDSVENNKVAAWFNGTRGVILAVQRQPGTNTVGVVDNIKEMLPTLRSEIPPSVNLSIAFDASRSIRGSIHDVEFTLVLTICLVVMVIFCSCEPDGDAHPRRGGAALHHRHFRGDVSARL